MKKILIIILILMSSKAFCITKPHWLMIDGAPFTDVKIFGAKGDGITDDRSAIQEAIEYAEANKTTLLFPSGTYLIGSANSDIATAGLLIRSPISIMGTSKSGSSPSSVIKNGTTGLDSLVLVGDGSAAIQGITLSNIKIDANYEAAYALKSNSVYVPYSAFTQVVFSKATTANILFHTYVSSFRNCIANNGLGSGFSIRGLNSAPATSITMSSCYANNIASYGYDFGFTTYSTYNSCAADNCGEGAYIFTAARGVVMNACGAESGSGSTPSAITVTTFRGFTINGFYGLKLGYSDDEISGGASAKPLFSFGGGTNAVISGVEFALSRNVGIDLALTGSSYGYENITIVDDSIIRARVTAVTNYAHPNYPIKFLRDDEISRAQKTNIALASTAAYLYTWPRGLPNRSITGSLEVRLATGTYDFPTNLDGNQRNPDSYIRNIGGTGKVTIKGGSATATETILRGDWQRGISVVDNSATIEFQNVTFTTEEGGGFSWKLEVDNSHVILTNCVIDLSPGNYISAIILKNGATLSMDTDTYASTSSGGNIAPGRVVFSIDASSNLLLEPRSAAPSGGKWSVGQTIMNSAVSSGQPIGWVSVAEDGNTWTNLYSLP